VPRSTQGKATPASGTLWVRVFLCAIVALAPVLSLAHNVIVAHAMCAEHGEAVHVGQPLARSRVVAQQALGHRVSSTPAATPEHGHMHCSMLVHNRERFAPVQPAQHGVLATLAQATVPTTPVRTFVPALSLLSLAPKGSPPV
jgi:hypothetical protein